MTPFVIRQKTFAGLPEGLRRYGGLSGFVLVSRTLTRSSNKTKLLTAMIHRDTEDGMYYAADYNSHHDAGLLRSLLWIFDDLREKATKFNRQ